MDKGLTIPNWMLINWMKIPEMPQNCLPKLKKLGFWWKKASLSVRSTWLSNMKKTRGSFLLHDLPGCPTWYSNLEWTSFAYQIHTSRVSAGLQTKGDDDRYNADEMVAGVSNSDAATTDAYDDTAYHSWLKPAKINLTWSDFTSFSMKVLADWFPFPVIACVLPYARLYNRFFSAREVNITDHLST